jgi:hypothetical protein
MARAGNVSRLQPPQQGWLLPVEVYTVMIELYANEVRAGSRVSKRRGSGEDFKTEVDGWAVGQVPGGTSRRRLAYAKMRDVYDAVCNAEQHNWWKFTRSLVLAGSIQRTDFPRPDARFFNAYIKHLVWFWRLPTGGTLPFRLETAEDRLHTVSKLQEDMERFGIPVPEGIREEETSLRKQVASLKQAISGGKSHRSVRSLHMEQGNAIPTWRMLVEVQCDRGMGRRGPRQPNRKPLNSPAEAAGEDTDHF